MNRLLIANRGEIALRILRAARELDIETVVVYTSVDRHLPYLALADEAVCIDSRSYLNSDAIIAAALSRGCDALHPGYGFLSENADFARRVEQHEINFVGPCPDDIALMADKSAARRYMLENDVPTLPGSGDVLDNTAQAIRLAADIGYPVMLKAAHGGGGRGIRVVQDKESLTDTLAEVRAHALQLFGDDSVYLEKYLRAPRHIEIQVAGDGKGKVISLGARDCSIQRAHQKLVEESPPPGTSTDRLAALEDVCLEALAAMSYRSVGTLEFLEQDDEIFFIEMNTRIQVEHPVTEAVTGVDLICLQLEIADAGELTLDQSDIHLRGHAIECRINAEDENFVPAPGVVESLKLPGGPGVRVDSHLAGNYKVPYFYDSLVAKVICHGADRNHAIRRMRRALAELEIKPLQTNIQLHQAILGDESFVLGEYSTQFLEKERSP